MLGCFLQGRLDLARMRKIVMVASGIQAPGTLLQLDAAAIEKRLRDVARGLDHPVPMLLRGGRIMCGTMPHAKPTTPLVTRP